MYDMYGIYDIAKDIWKQYKTKYIYTQHMDYLMVPVL